MVIGREGKLDSMEKNWASAGAKFVVVYGSHKSGKTAVLSEFAKEERFLLAIDDFADLVFEDRTILKDFRNAFENEWRNSNIFVVAGCGRVFFTESEILAENSAVSLRRPVIYKLEELDYIDSAKLLPKEISAKDKMRYYCCLGGIPEYLGLVESGKTFEENIRNIFLKKTSPLFREPTMLFLDELREPEF